MYRFALDNLISRPFRAILSILGLAVAIGGMVGLFSIAGGINQLVNSTFAMVPGLLVQERGAPVPIFSSLPAAWQAEIEQMDGVSVVNPEILVRVNVLDGQPVISPPRFLLGFDIPSRMKLKESIYGDKIVAGRFLNAADAGTTNCLVSKPIAEASGKTLGDTLFANGNELAIVGIYECGTMLLDCNILVDMDTLRRLARYDEGSVSCFYVETEPGCDQNELGDRIEALFQGRPLKRNPATQATNALTALVTTLHHTVTAIGASGAQKTPASLPPETKTGNAQKEPAKREAPSPVEARSADDWAEKFDDFTGDLNFFLTLITGVGITIAVLSIVNVMLMSVTERTIEFGILRANGWSRRNVMSLVTLESAVLGVVGGILGAIGGWIAVQLINSAFPEKAHLYAGFFLLGFAVALSTALGVLGGLYPAWRAARMSPMDAIRRG